jgi:indole-3-glycerol phosphate synthase
VNDRLPNLDKIVADVRRRAAERRVKQPLARLKDIVREDSWRRERFLSALLRAPFPIIGECRRRSARGEVLLAEAEGRSAIPTRLPAPGPRWFALAQGLQQGGVAALSVATELDTFGGSLDDLRAVEFTMLPRIRDDFVIDEAMLYEACLWGADAIVLRPSILDDTDLPWLRGIAKEYGIAVIAEAGDQRDLARVLALEPEALAIGRVGGSGEFDWAENEALVRGATESKAFKLAAVEPREASVLVRLRSLGFDGAIAGEAPIRAADARLLLERWREALAAGA